MDRFAHIPFRHAVKVGSGSRITSLDIFPSSLVYRSSSMNPTSRSRSSKSLRFPVRAAAMMMPALSSDRWLAYGA